MTGTMIELHAETLRKKLRKLRQEIEAELVSGKESSGIVELDQSKVGRLSRMDALQVQAMAQASVRRLEVTLRNIDSALRRIDEDTYGSCQRCEEPIAPKRLEFDPAALFCIECAEQAEKSA